jgi:tryptophan synthase beta chain
MKFNNIDFDTYLKNYPSKDGFFGKYGGASVSPELKIAMKEITEAYNTICKSRKFIDELRRMCKEVSQADSISLSRSGRKHS